MAQMNATFVADFSDFYSAVQEATVKLREFDSGASQVEKSLSRMVDSFSGRKIIQEATLMAEAIERLEGGLSSLSDAELQKVAATASLAVEKMRALGMDVPPSLAELADRTKDVATQNETLGVSVTTLVQSYLTAEAAIAVLKGAYDLLVGGIKAAISAAAEAEAGDAKLLASLQAQGTAMPSVVTAYNDYAAALQKTTTFSDDAVKAATALLVTVGNVMPKDMEKALTATSNLAAALGTDLPEAAQIVARAATGTGNSLKKYGIETEDASGKTLDFDSILTNIDERFHGIAESAGNTAAGGVAKLANSWDDMLESVGRVITENETVRGLLAGINEILQDNTGELNKNSTANNLVSDAAILVAKGLGLAVEGVDLFQKTLVDMRGVITSTEKELLAFYSLLLQIEKFTQEGVYAVSGSNEAALRLREVGENAQWVAERLQTITQAQQDAEATSAEWSTGLQALRGRIGEVVTGLEAKRGATKASTAAADENSEAWKRNTTNQQAAAEAAKKAAAEAAADQKKLNEAMQEYDSVGASYVDTLLQMDAAMVAGIASDLERGQSQQTLATVYGVTASQIKAVVEMLKQQEDAQELATKQAQILNRLSLELTRAQLEGSKDLLQARLKDIQAEADAKIASLKIQQTGTQEMYDKIQAIADQHSANIIQSTLAQDEGSKASYQQKLDDAKAHYNQMISFSNQYTTQQIEAGKLAVVSAEEDLANWETRAHEAFAGTRNEAGATADAINSISSAVQGVSQSLEGLKGQIGWDPEAAMAQVGGGSLESMAAGRLTGGKRLAGHVSMATMDAQRAWDQHLAQQLVKMQNAGGGEFGGGSRNDVRVEAGAVTMNYPIMNDPSAKDQIASIVGDAVMAKLTRAGVRF